MRSFLRACEKASRQISRRETGLAAAPPIYATASPQRNSASVNTQRAARWELYACAPARELLVFFAWRGVVLDPVLLPHPRVLRRALPSRPELRLQALAQARLLHQRPPSERTGRLSIRVSPTPPPMFGGAECFFRPALLGLARASPTGQRDEPRSVIGLTGCFPARSGGGSEIGTAAPEFLPTRHPRRCSAASPTAMKEGMMGTRLASKLAMVVIAAVMIALPSAAAGMRHPHALVVSELVTFAAPGCTGTCGSGSTIGPDGALYVTDGKTGRVLRVDTSSGAVSTFAAGLPLMNTPPGIGGAIDVAFVGHTAYVLVANVGAFFGEPGEIAGIYRVRRNGSAVAVADIGAWSEANPPDTDFV